jgi:HlyD family secretion protein
LQAQINAVKTKSYNINSQVDVQNEQKNTLLIEKERLEKLLKDGAATQKQMDDINGRIAVIESQIKSIGTQNTSVSGEVVTLEKQIDQVKDQIARSYIKNPVTGTVLEKYAEVSEIAAPGKSLYKIASLDELYLRVYVSGAQLSNLKIGQQVKVKVDDANGGFKDFPGTVTWISAQAEFTPKIIQTREERVNLVYAVKIKVKNDGTIKIGMPGEVDFK